VPGDEVTGAEAPLLWVDRQEVDGPALHALLIGVSDYQFLPASQDEFPPEGKVTLGLTKLKTPAAGAFRVAKWLKEKYWHPAIRVKTIRLLLSPSTEEAENEMEGMAIAPANRAITANVAKALNDWKDACRKDRDGIAFLYVAGHGIRWSNTYDSIVLLEDFGTIGDFLSETIDLEKTKRAMKGNDLPATQYLFADACKVNPDEVARWAGGDDPGTPKAPKMEPKNNAVVCAPLYCAAYSGQLAGGYRGEGTYFSQALVECLDGYGWTPPTESAGDAIEARFRITPGGLAENLQERVKAIALAKGDTQTIIVGEYLPGMGALCASENPPVAPFKLTVSPDQAAAVATANLLDGEGMFIRQRDPCHPPPLTIPDVRVGTHTLDLDLTAGAKYKKPPPRPVVVKPFLGWSGSIELK
jgi:hypothetical protein